MHVVATAGHVDHGKSTLVRALTGMEPDRLAEERRRGMTLDLGFAWTTVGAGERVAFVDVPGHERFVTTMLAGVGPVPAVLLVVAADEGWMPQTEEHLAAVTALGARRLLLAVTKSDSADPAPAAAEAAERLAAHGHHDVPAVAVSAATGEGLDHLRSALAALVQSLPATSSAAPVRLWVDRAFTVRGAGTVVTGTLAAGRIRTGDRLTLGPDGREVAVRGLQSLGEALDEVTGVARVAVNLRGVDRDEVRRGSALVTPGAWTGADTVDVLLDGDLPRGDLVAHLGSAAVPARCRPLGASAARLQLAAPLPMHLGDRLLLRAPASRKIAAAVVADLHPAPLRRRGDALRVGTELTVPGTVDEEVKRRGLCRGEDVGRLGLPGGPETARAAGGWLVAPALWEQLRGRLQTLLASQPDAADGIPVATLRRAIDLPDDAIVTALAGELDDVVCTDGRVRPAREERPVSRLAPLLARLAAEPLAAPDADELRALDVTRAELARAVSEGLLLRIADGLYVGPAAPEAAVAVLETLPSPFAVSEARQALGSTRRVVVPLLEHLDAARRTRRLPDGTRVVVGRAT